MHLAYKKHLVNLQKFWELGRPPPHVGKNSQIIPYFFSGSVPKESFLHYYAHHLYFSTIMNPDQGCTSLTMAMLSYWKPGEPGLMSPRRVRLVRFILTFILTYLLAKSVSFTAYPLPTHFDRLRGQRCSGIRAMCKTSWEISSPLALDPSGDQCIHT